MLAISKYDPLEDIPASFPAGERWYVFYSRIRAEERAGEEISELGYETFVPIETRRNPETRRIVRWALFGRYGFVRFDLNHAGWGEIVDVKSVIDLVRINGIPRSVPDGIIHGIQVADRIGIFDHTQPPKIGTEVEVMTGPFAEQIGRICRARSAERVDVLLRILGGERIVSLQIAALRER